jgi:hypothetical protein
MKKAMMAILACALFGCAEDSEPAKLYDLRCDIAFCNKPDAVGWNNPEGENEWFDCYWNCADYKSQDGEVHLSAYIRLHFEWSGGDTCWFLEEEDIEDDGVCFED